LRRKDNARVGGSTSIILKNTTYKLLRYAHSFSTREVNLMLICYLIEELNEKLLLSNE
jgi:hypothetical protein